jgi:methyl-accepting chemotaxis protein
LWAFRPTGCAPPFSDVIHDAFENYANDFAVLAMVQTKIGMDETSGLSGSLRKVLNIVEAGVSEINDSKLTGRLLIMPRHEKGRRDGGSLG